MASRLLRVCGAWRALRVGPGPLAAGSRAASTGGMPTDEEQATGMERKIMDTIKKGEVRKMPLKRTTFGFTKIKWSAALRVGPISN
ncbi:hypothetical protein Chor_002238 [Crotalus horridus]